MDDASISVGLMTVDDDDEAADEEDLCILATAALIVTAAEAGRPFRNERRGPTWNYLTRRDLAPNPHFGTAWNHIFKSQNDRSFITTMGFDVETFNFILDSGFGELWNLMPIPRDDTNSSGNSQPR
jgi:hypothetical protein